MPSGVYKAKRVIINVRVSIERERVIEFRYNGVRAGPAVKIRVIPPCPVVV
jgi:hypothetical protein